MLALAGFFFLDQQTAASKLSPSSKVILFTTTHHSGAVKASQETKEMALLSSRTPAGYGSNIAAYRVQQPSTQHHGFFASPTESEFSEHFDSPGTVR